MAVQKIDWNSDDSRDIIDDADEFEVGTKGNESRVRILDDPREWPWVSRHWINAGGQAGYYQCTGEEDCPACKVGSYNRNDPVSGKVTHTIVNIIQYVKVASGASFAHKTWQLRQGSQARKLKKLYKEHGDLREVDLNVTSTNPTFRSWDVSVGNGNWTITNNLTDDVEAIDLWSEEEIIGKLARECTREQLESLIKIAQTGSNDDPV